MCTNKTISKKQPVKERQIVRVCLKKNVQKAFKTTTSMQSSLHWFLLHWTCDAIKPKTDKDNL